MPEPGPEQTQSLIFVYNADSGLFNTVTDIAHKIFAPETYACQLCALTHGYFKVHGEWKRFIESLGVPCEFFHRDEARDQLSLTHVELPAIYRRTATGLTICLRPAQIKACQELETLRRAITEHCCPERTR